MIQVEIINDGRRGDCQSECGADWSQPEVLAQARRAIRDRFGDTIRLDYIDLSKSVDSKRMVHLKQFAKARELPLLLINSMVRLSGQFDMHQLIGALEVQMEIGAQV